MKVIISTIVTGIIGIIIGILFWELGNEDVGGFILVYAAFITLTVLGILVDFKHWKDEGK